ncbi:hypothetical protein ROA7450_04032 [Roseovarius albus]|uniref:Uncharacterized protein n=1 Tax=Roseovarius albus TaxID=1247867 RepID=A0A1X7A9Q4_9RHOB|nr:hypothetical protein ROA7450_04032 [Roseovarius albus]
MSTVRVMVLIDTNQYNLEKLYYLDGPYSSRRGVECYLKREHSR